MTLVTVAQIEHKESARGGFTRACVVMPDGARVWASAFKTDVAARLEVGRQLEVEFATSGDRGQFTDIVSAADPSLPLPGMPAPRVTNEGTIAMPANDATAERIYRCTALNAAVAYRSGTEAGLEEVLRFAEGFYAWLQGQPGPGERRDGEPF